MQQAQTAVEALRLMGLPAAAVVNDGQVLAANMLFVSALQSVTLVDERIVLADADAMQSYGYALDRLRGGWLESLSILLPVIVAEPAAILHLVPMPSFSSDRVFERGSLVIITSLSARTLPSIEMLHGLFDLTPAEARLARGLAGGRNIGEIASQYKVSQETIRSQIKQVFAKTRTRSQAELVGLVTRLPPLS